MKPGEETMQAVMRKREGIEPRQTFNFCGGRASIWKRRQHRRGVGESKLMGSPAKALAPPGSETMACIEGKQWNLGDLYRAILPRGEPENQPYEQGLEFKFKGMHDTGVRCSHSSEEAE